MRRFPGLVAALVVPCLASCGKVERFTDAGTTDASEADADVSIDAQPPGQVTVTTHSRCCDVATGTLVGGVDVFVVQPDGTLGDRGVTDAAGTVTLDDVEAGAVVTAVYAEDNPAELYRNRDVVSVVGVEPGDALVFGEHYTYNNNPVSTGTMTVTWPSTANTSTFYVYTPCTSTSAAGTATSVTLDVYQHCQTTTGDVAVIRYDTVASRYAAATLRDVSVMPGATVGPAAFTAPVDLAVSATGLPVHVESVRFDVAYSVPYVVEWNNNTYVDPTDGSASTSLQTPGGSDRFAGDVQLYRSGEFGSQHNLQSFPGDATAAPFTIVELPWLGDQLLSASAQFLTWVQVGDQAYDGAVAQIGWQRHTDGPDGGEGYYTRYDWTVLLPPGVTTFTWEDPPAELAPYLPALGDGPGLDLSLVDLASEASFDELRGTAEWIFADPRGANMNGELTGRATVSEAGSGGGSGEQAAPAPALLRDVVVQGTR